MAVRKSFRILPVQPPDTLRVVMVKPLWQAGNQHQHPSVLAQGTRSRAMKKGGGAWGSVRTSPRLEGLRCVQSCPPLLYCVLEETLAPRTALSQDRVEGAS